jgi:hypothetical protein
MKQTITLILLLLILLIQFSVAQPGKTGLSFLKLGVGSRALAMGEAYTAIASDPTAIHFNPAALSLSKSPQILLMHRQWIQDVKTEYISAKTSLNQFSFGIAVNATSVDNIELRTTPGLPIGTFSARNAAIGGGISYDFDTTLSFGLAVNYLYEKLYVEEAQGLGVNFGALYLSPWNVRFGFAVNNIGSMNELKYEASKIPTQIRFGAGYEMPLESIDASLLTATDIVSSSVENKSHVNFGIEFIYSKTFAARLGYQTGYEAKSISAGVGVMYGMARFDYAFVPFKYELGSTHTFTVGVEF